MRLVRVIFVLLAALLLGFASLCDAQEGGYVNSCRDVRFGFIPRLLYATCSGYNPGTSIETALDLNTCIGNANGRLVWNRNGWFYSSYRKFELLFDGKLLLAECLRQDQKTWMPTQLGLNERIKNRGGYLRCWWDN